MKKTTLVLTAFLFTIFSFSQVSVGSEEWTNQSQPVEPYYEYSYSQTIYNANLINASGQITGLKYFATPTTDLENTGTWDIYMAHTDLNEHPQNEDGEYSFVDASGLTLVFSGPVEVVDQTVTISLDTPFDYNGTQNLIVAGHDTMDTGTYDGSGDDFYSSLYDGSSRVALVYYNDVTPPDPLAPPSPSDALLRYANIVFEGITQQCPNPTDISVSNILGTSADFTWSSGENVVGYEYAILPAGEELESGTAISENSVSVSGLDPLTNYVFYIRSQCDGEYSGVVSYAFTTGCADLFELPFSESFEQDSENEICWTIIDLSPEAAPNNSSWNTNVSNAFEGSQAAWLYTYGNQGKNDDYLISPRFNLSGNDRIKFAAKSYGNGEPNNSMAVLMSTTTSNPEDFTITLSETTEYSGDWTEVNIDLSAYSGPAFIAFYVPPTSVEGYAMYVDAIVVEEIPDCDAPLSVTLDNITSESAEISWSPGASQETQWEYILQEAGADQPTESGTLIDTSSILLEGLVQGAEYDFYVRAACDNGSFSQYVPDNGVYFMIPPVGGVCEDPLVIESFPFSVTDDTINYQDDYDGAPGDAESCSTASSYMGGDDVFYSYTAPNDMSVTVTFDPVNTWSGIFVYDSCDSIGVSCIAGSASSSANERIFELDLYENQTYLIAISTYPSPQSTPFELTIVEDSCDPPVVEVSNLPCDENQNFLVEVNISDMGSSSQYNIFDDLGNEQVVESSGILTFGPYNGNQQIFIQGDDPNCFQDYDINTVCNDECTGAFAIDPGEIVNGDTNLATDSGNNPSNDLWYSYTGNGEADNVTVSLCGSSYDTYLRVFDACDGTQISFNDDYCSTQSELTFDSDGTTTYYIMVEGYSSYNGEFVLNISSTLGVNDYQLVGLKIYPNPADGNYVTIKSPISGDKFINIFDINGRNVLSTTLVGDMLNISSMSSGFYMIEVIVGNYRKVSKLVIE